MQAHNIVQCTFIPRDFLPDCGGGGGGPDKRGLTVRYSFSHTPQPHKLHNINMNADWLQAAASIAREKE